MRSARVSRTAAVASRPVEQTTFSNRQSESAEPTIRQVTAPVRPPLNDRSQPAGEPIANPKPKKAPVRFNMERLQKLSGWEKITLLRDFCKYSMTKEALIVYHKLRENDIIQRLDYQDHHAMYHLLLSDPVRYRSDITEIVEYMLSINATPTPNLLSTYIKCCRKWADLVRGRWALNKMLSCSMQVDVVSWNDLLIMHLQSESPGSEHFEYGIEIWNMMNAPDVRAMPDLTTFLTVMSLYGNLGKVKEAEAIYDRAAAAITQITISRMKSSSPRRDGVIDRSNSAAHMQKLAAVRLFNGLLAVYATSGSFDKAIALADRFLSE
eukprot:jgi/Hompol1/3954/HPOL_006844-RA